MTRLQIRRRVQRLYHRVVDAVIDRLLPEREWPRATAEGSTGDASPRREARPLPQAAADGPGPAAEAPAAPSRWVEVASLQDLEEGAPRVVVVDGVDYVLYRVGEEVHATLDECPHASGPLGAGRLEGYTIVCPYHEHRFDIRSGRCETLPSLTARVVPVEVREGGRICLGL